METATFVHAVTAAVIVILESLQDATSLLAHEKLPLGLVVICLIEVLPRLPAQVQVIGTLPSTGVMAPLINPNAVGLLVNRIDVTAQVGGGTATPAWITCTVCPATVMSAMRCNDVVFALAVTVIVALPEPLPVPTTSHGAFETAAQKQPTAVVRVKLVLPPAAATFWLAGVRL